jgi:hypothetical protein
MATSRSRALTFSSRREARRRSSSSSSTTPHERWNEEPVDRDAEGPDDLVEDVEGGVGGAAFDIGDGLTRDAGGFGEGSLRESSSGSGDDEVRLRISLKGGRDVGAFGDMTAPFGG